MTKQTDPIIVYEQADMWHVDYGGGTTSTHSSEAEALQEAKKIANREGREVKRK
jgi:hypothetical protein